MNNIGDDGAGTRNTVQQKNVCPDDGTSLLYYHGCLGYEALYCPKCGYFGDVIGNVGHDDSFKREGF
jgi:hypothetical protein